jgi:hypothetical protein
VAQSEIDLSAFYPEALRILKVQNNKKEIHIFIKSQTHTHINAHYVGKCVMITTAPIGGKYRTFQYLGRQYISI